MNVMQSLADFKQNLRNEAHAAPAGRLPTASGASGAAVPASTSAASSADTSGSTTITANDFLQLLVAEMKNQDPTSQQDPNAYIDQLVQVNSLQQLIAINQDLNPTGAASSATGNIARARGSGPGGGLGSAAGSPAASVAASLGPHPRQPAAPSPAANPSASPALSDGVAAPGRGPAPARFAGAGNPPRR
jgi:flagellar basal-body rod modification protein FlgD